MLRDISELHVLMEAFSTKHSFHHIMSGCAKLCPESQQVDYLKLRA